MKICIALLTLLLAGCSTVVPVTQKFPEAPQVLLQPCKPLKELNKDASLVDLTKVVVENYSEYYLCSELVLGWQDWYKTQQKLYKELK